MAYTHETEAVQLLTDPLNRIALSIDRIASALDEINNRQRIPSSVHSEAAPINIDGAFHGVVGSHIEAGRHN